MHDALRDLLDGSNYAHVATVMPDGGPHCVPVWVGTNGDRIAILTGPTTQKARNLLRDPRVAISIIHRDQPFTMASVRGRVVEHRQGDAAWKVIDRIATKYTGRPYPRGEQRSVYLIEPDTVSAHSY